MRFRFAKQIRVITVTRRVSGWTMLTFGDESIGQ
jgi:hypothetical protein